MLHLFHKNTVEMYICGGTWVNTLPPETLAIIVQDTLIAKTRCLRFFFAIFTQAHLIVITFVAAASCIRERYKNIYASPII